MKQSDHYQNDILWVWYEKKENRSEDNGDGTDKWKIVFNREVWSWERKIIFLMPSCLVSVSDDQQNVCGSTNKDSFLYLHFIIWTSALFDFMKFLIIIFMVSSICFTGNFQFSLVLFLPILSGISVIYMITFSGTILLLLLLLLISIMFLMSIQEDNLSATATDPLLMTSKAGPSSPKARSNLLGKYYKVLNAFLLDYNIYAKHNFSVNSVFQNVLPATNIYSLSRDIFQQLYYSQVNFLFCLCSLW